jgi:serpin B
VKMMIGLKEKAAYGKGTGYEAAEIPFDGEELSMVLIVPDSGSHRTFEKGLTPAIVEEALAGLSAHSVYLELPRFGFTSRSKLSSALKALGMVDAFDPNAANFEGICGVSGGNAGLVIDEVIHQAFVQVTEKGAEAAAATAVTMKDAGTAYPPETPIRLTVDRPFLFLIRDRVTGAVLFMGRVIDPNA